MAPSGSEPFSSEATTTRLGGPLAPGTVLGRYVIEEPIGEGGMGVVYRARDARLGRKVALKVLIASEDDPESVERTKRFIREAKSAAALDHPNAVSIFDVGETGEWSFIAMELVNGKSLRAYVGAPDGARPGLEGSPEGGSSPEGDPVTSPPTHPDFPSPLARADVAQRLRWLVDIAAALAAAHRARLIHRDIKPENVMIRDDGRVKVLDFGLARRPNARVVEAPAPLPPREQLPKISSDTTMTETGQSTITAVGTLLGTPQYMAPEQIRSDPLDARSDQFSWGVVAYELLTGELPWKGAGIHVMARILTDDPQPIRELNPAVPEEAVAVVMRALERAPDDRFPSMDDVIAALDPFAEAASQSDPRSLRARSVPPRTGPTTRPPPAIVLGDAPLLAVNKTQRSADHVSPRGGAPKGSHRASHSPRVKVVDAPDRARSRGLATVAVAGALALGIALGGWRALRRAPVAPPAAVSESPAPDRAVTMGGDPPYPPARPAASAVTDLPDPRTASPDALAAYRAGLADLRFGGTRGALERATVIDPSLAAAHLQCAVDATEYEIDKGGRAHLRKAMELRAQLGERDQLLLDALVPVLLHQPADWAEAGRLLVAATDRFPGDAQLWYERAAFAQAAEGPAVSARYAERAIELDPRYAQAMSLQGQDLAYLGRYDEARDVLRRGLVIAPGYVTCASELGRILAQQGACDEEETLARQLVTASADQVVAQGLLASALAARGRPETAVREALKLKWAAAADADRQREEQADTLSLELLAGDFVAAERDARAIEASVESSRRETVHGHVARLLAQIYTETGRVADAGHVAEVFLGRRDAWEQDARSEDFAMADDATPELIAAALRGAKITRADLAARRAEWLLGWERKAPPDYRRYLWTRGFAATVDTPEDATVALAALPGYEPLPVYYPRTLAEAAVGRTFLLGGRQSEALSWLERATRTCKVLEQPVDHTRAQLWLGMAREAAGDKQGACAAYRVVHDRWGKGKASPRSVTAEKAAALLRALACGP